MFEGEFVNDKKQGKGRLVRSNGGTQEGTFENDMMTHGTLTQPDGLTYTGPFENGRFHGKGELKTKQFQYEGDFVFGLQSGFGSCLILPAGDRYEGEFKDGKKNGNGTVNFADGRRIKITFVNDRMHGIGSYYASASAEPK